MLTFDQQDNISESLLDICLTYIVRHLDTICYFNISTNSYKLHEGLVLPRELCEKLLKFYQSKSGPLDDRFIKIFGDSSVTGLGRVCLRNSSVTDNGLQAILKHNLEELHLENCKNVTTESLFFLNKYGKNLRYLTIGHDVELLTPDIYNGGHFCIFKTPKLKSLALRNSLMSLKNEEYFKRLVSPLQNLTHLDLSGCTEVEGFSFLLLVPNLEFLVLYNSLNVQEGLFFIYHLKKLR